MPGALGRPWLPQWCCGHISDGQSSLLAESCPDSWQGAHCLLALMAWTVTRMPRTRGGWGPGWVDWGEGQKRRVWWWGRGFYLLLLTYLCTWWSSCFKSSHFYCKCREGESLFVIAKKMMKQERHRWKALRMRERAYLQMQWRTAFKSRKDCRQLLFFFYRHALSPNQVCSGMQGWPTSGQNLSQWEKLKDRILWPSPKITDKIRYPFMKKIS